MDPNGKNGGKVEAMNAAVRSACVVFLVLTLCGAFLWGAYREKPIVSTDAFVGILAAAITWLFKSRDEKQTQEAQTTTTKITEIDPTSGAKREVMMTAPLGTGTGAGSQVAGVIPVNVVNPTPGAVKETP